MTTPMQKIEDLCKKHRFKFYAYGIRPCVFFNRLQPRIVLEISGTDVEQIYQKFMAILQAMDLEPPTPTGISADKIQPGSDWYEVIEAAGHDTLNVGDSVQMVEAPIGCRIWLYRLDGTLHQLMSEEGNYITLISKPFPTPDAPPPTPIQFNINNSVKVRLTDYGRDILRQKLDLRHSFERVDAQGYTKFQLWELMNIFGSYIYNGSTRQCFNANIALLEFPQP